MTGPFVFHEPSQSYVRQPDPEVARIVEIRNYLGGIEAALGEAVARHEARMLAATSICVILDREGFTAADTVLRNLRESIAERAAMVSTEPAGAPS